MPIKNTPLVGFPAEEMYKLYSQIQWVGLYVDHLTMNVSTFNIYQDYHLHSMYAFWMRTEKKPPFLYSKVAFLYIFILQKHLWSPAKLVPVKWILRIKRDFHERIRFQKENCYQDTVEQMGVLCI